MKVVILLALLIAGCSGSDNGEIEKQIVSGTAAGNCEFPHMAYLLMKHSDGSYTTCGGSLIDPYHILTAAHCINDVVKVIAHMGHANNRASPQVIEAYRWKSHEGYAKGRNIVNDLGMIQLERPVRLGRCVKPISLPKKNQVFSGTCIAAGWGRLSNSRTGPDHMRKAHIKVIPTAACQKFAYKIAYDQHICVGDGSKMGKNICKGDSGGPLMCKSGDEYVVAGVASYIYNCEKGFGVYANVAGLLDWVENAQRTV